MFVFIYSYICMYIYKYIYTYIYVFMYVYIHIYIYIYIYIYICLFYIGFGHVHRGNNVCDHQTTSKLKPTTGGLEGSFRVKMIIEQTVGGVFWFWINYWCVVMIRVSKHSNHSPTHVINSPNVKQTKALKTQKKSSSYNWLLCTSTYFHEYY
jgi:hypothetical protein